MPGTPEQKKGELIVGHVEILKYLELLSDQGIQILSDIICVADDRPNGNGYFFEKEMEEKKTEIKLALTAREYKLILALITGIKQNINSFSGYSNLLSQEGMTHDQKKLLFVLAFSTTDINFTHLNEWANDISDD